MPYVSHVPSALFAPLGELADQCRDTRHKLQELHETDGFFPKSGSLIKEIVERPLRQEWDLGRWPQGATTQIHKQLLELTLLMNGLTGELGAPFEVRDPHYSPAPIARSVVEVASQIFWLLVEPVGARPSNPEDLSDKAIKTVHARSQLLTLEQVHEAALSTRLEHEANPSTQTLEASQHYDSETFKLIQVISPLWNSTELAKRRSLGIEGERIPSLTDRVSQLGSWMASNHAVPDDPIRYRFLSGMTHGNLFHHAQFMPTSTDAGSMTVQRKVDLSFLMGLVDLTTEIAMAVLGTVGQIYAWGEPATPAS